MSEAITLKGPGNIREKLSRAIKVFRQKITDLLPEHCGHCNILNEELHFDSGFSSSGFGLFELECLFGAIPKEDWAIILAKMPPDVAKKVKKRGRYLQVFK